jgi:DNA-binding winged helix-turn-helix (wHTH) protein/Tol biopolymer transport system component
MREGQVKFGEFVFDLDDLVLRRGGKYVKLKPLALKMLAVFVKNPGRLLSRDELLDMVWGESAAIENQNVDNTVHQIRRIIGEEYIIGVPGRGYIFEADALSVKADAPPVQEKRTGIASLLNLLKRSRPDQRPRLWLAVCGCLLLAVIALAVLDFSNRELQSPAPPVIRFPIMFDEKYRYVMLAVSPDGKYVAYVEGTGSGQLWLQKLYSVESAQPLPNTNGARFPFWSPDSKSLAFFADGTLKKTGPTGKEVQTLCLGEGTHCAMNPRGGTWSQKKGVIVFSPDPNSPLMQVSEQGGIPTLAIPTPHDNSQVGNVFSEANRFPSFLPDGVHYMYHVLTNRRGSDGQSLAGLYIGALDSGDRVRVLDINDETNAIYVSTKPDAAVGFIFFRRPNDQNKNYLMVQAFDPNSLKLVDTACPLVLEDVMHVGYTGGGAFSASANGVLVYQSRASPEDRALMWFDRRGHILGTAIKAAQIRPDSRMAISPDDTKVAISIGPDFHSEIATQDLTRDVPMAIFHVDGQAWYPVWSPDGQWLAYGLQPRGSRDGELWIQPRNGPVGTKLALPEKVGVNIGPWAVSPDLKKILYRQDSPQDLWLLSLDGTSKPARLLAQATFDRRDGQFSPDGEWIAYASNESRQYRIYVQKVDPPGTPFPVPGEGGDKPRWNGNSKELELYYLSDNRKLMAVGVKPRSAEPVFDTPTELFARDDIADYAPSGDGRFLVNVPAPGVASPAITAVINWQSCTSPNRN